jgi:hypothetical protein
MIPVKGNFPDRFVGVRRRGAVLDGAFCVLLREIVQAPGIPDYGKIQIGLGIIDACLQGIGQKFVSAPVELPRHVLRDKPRARFGVLRVLFGPCHEFLQFRRLGKQGLSLFRLPACLCGELVNSADVVRQRGRFDCLL